MVTREVSLPASSGDGRLDKEVLSSHPAGADHGPGRGRTSIVVMALMLLALGLSLQTGPDTHPSGTTCAADHTRFERPSAWWDESRGVDVIDTDCRRVRRLVLWDMDTLLFVEVGPRVVGGSRRASPSGGQEDSSIRFARIVAAHSLAEDRTSPWIMVRCVTRQCATPELALPTTDSASPLIR